MCSDFEDLLAVLNELYRDGKIEFSQEFVEQPLDHDVHSTVAYIAQIAEVPVPVALHAVALCLIDPPHGIGLDAINEYIRKKKAGAH